MADEDLFAVTIDFETSHLFFPTIVVSILAFLGALILLTRWRKIWAAKTEYARARDHVAEKTHSGSWRRLSTTIFLVALYFYLMPVVGDFYPNTGFGFLICSVFFVLALGALFLPHWTRRGMATLGVSGVLAPTVVWLVMAEFMNVSLP